MSQSCILSMMSTGQPSVNLPIRSEASWAFSCFEDTTNGTGIFTDQLGWFEGSMGRPIRHGVSGICGQRRSRPHRKVWTFGFPSNPNPKHSMYAIFVYIFVNVCIYSIHGVSGNSMVRCYPPLQTLKAETSVRCDPPNDHRPWSGVRAPKLTNPFLAAGLVKDRGLSDLSTRLQQTAHQI